MCCVLNLQYQIIKHILMKAIKKYLIFTKEVIIIVIFNKNNSDLIPVRISNK